MFQFIRKKPIYIAARFIDIPTTEKAGAEITMTLTHAENEVRALFDRQRGIAESADIFSIYARHGFSNDSGWFQGRPLSTSEDTLFWEIPEGMVVDEAKDLLISLGALSVVETRGEVEDELMDLIPHPAALFLSDMENSYIDLDEDDQIFSAIKDEKKLLH